MIVYGLTNGLSPVISPGLNPRELGMSIARVATQGDLIAVTMAS